MPGLGVAVRVGRVVEVVMCAEIGLGAEEVDRRVVDVEGRRACAFASFLSSFCLHGDKW